MHISEINVYPIKSLKGIAVDSWPVEKRGLRYDRRWMLTRTDGTFMTQREFPRMALIEVTVSDDGLDVSMDGRFLKIPSRPVSGERRSFEVWGRPGDAIVYNGEVSDWFSESLETDCQLVYMPDDSDRRVGAFFDRGGDVVSFADGYPLMVIGEGSLEELNSRIAASGAHADETSAVPVPLPMNRFRPNIVVSGSDAFAEDDWKRVRVGETVFIGTKPSERCVLTTVDQARGEFDGKEPLKTLATFRRTADVIPDRYESFGMGPNSVLFGQNLMVDNPGASISVGDSVEVLERY